MADGGTAKVVAQNVTAMQTDDESVESNLISNLISASGGTDITLGQAKFNAKTVSSVSNGLNIRIDPLGYVQANTGAITADNDGINAQNNLGASLVDVSSVNSGNYGVYSQVEGNGAVNIIDVDGNVEAADNSAVVIQNDDSGKAMVLISNDAASAASSETTGGLSFYSSDAGAQAIALVMGVLSGHNGIVLEQGGYDKPQETLDLTVWKVEANGGSIIQNNIEGADTDAFAKSVSYIVMVEQPTAGGTVRATKADGSPLDRKFSEDSGLYGDMLDLIEQLTGEEAALVDEVGFAIAHETDKVLLKVDLEKGYKVAGAYNGMGERVELNVDDNGDYYVIVERGGGIYLSVDLELESYDIDFDLDGGTLNGQTGHIVQACEYGSVIQLPDAPTREGYNFLYWQGSHYAPGASYTVKGAHTFKAVWEKQTFNITFVNEDGTELQSSSVAYGEMPSYSGATPTKAATSENSYEFAGWTPGVVAATSDATYTATYKATPVSATLIFDLAGGTLDGKTGTVTIDAIVGDTVKLPAAPTREGYAFKYWKGSEYEAGADYKVEGDHAFTAVWEKSATPAKPAIPETGDPTASMFVIFAAFVAISVLCLALVVFARRRHDGHAYSGKHAQK